MKVRCGVFDTSLEFGDAAISDLSSKFEVGLTLDLGTKTFQFFFQ